MRHVEQCTTFFSSSLHCVFPCLNCLILRANRALTSSFIFFATGPEHEVGLTADVIEDIMGDVLIDAPESTGIVSSPN